MAQGDRYLAKIIVVEDGTTCMGDVEFYDEKTLTNSFDKYSFESMELIKPDLPTRVGSLIRIDYEDGSDIVFAMLRDGGGWVTTRLEETIRVLSAADLQHVNWALVV